MVETKVWSSRPIFISSTFRDMQQERDYLRDFVFPELSERLRERCCHLESIDLRWGVETVSTAEQEAKELLVLKVCLNEIERSRPFLIVLLGDRYGWVPPKERMEAAIQEKDFNTKITGKSVTALEIEFGVLDSPGQQKRSFFYFRNPLPYKEMPPEIAAKYSDLHNPGTGAKEAWERLQVLKECIKMELPERVRNYAAKWDAENQKITGLEEWGRQVFEDLWQELEAETNAAAEQIQVTWQDKERNTLEEFVEYRTHGFAGRDDVVIKLKQFALSKTGREHWGTVIAGAAGTGKSSVFAKLVRDLSKEDCLVLANAAGISPLSSKLDILLDRWVQELSGNLNIPNPLTEQSSIEEKQEQFANLLSRASVNKRIICLIDALNQFERTPIARHLTWLPEIWPENARLIATAIPGEETKNLAKQKGINIYDLPQIDENDAVSIIDSISGRYHKTLHQDVIDILTTKKGPNDALATGSPLWLSIALEELFLLDEDDFQRAEKDYPGTPEEKLHALIEELPPTVEEIYSYLFVRAEKRFGSEWVRNVLSLLAVSRFGLREKDLRELIKTVTGRDWEDLQFATFRRYLRAHLVQRGEGYWDFTHAQVRINLQKNYLKNPKQVKQLHLKVADYIEMLPSEDTFRQNELMYHYYMADDKLRAAKYYGSNLSEAERAGATRVLAEKIVWGMNSVKNKGLLWSISLLGQNGLNLEEINVIANSFNFDLLGAVEYSVESSITIRLLNECISTLKRIFKLGTDDAATYTRNLSISYSKLGSLYLLKGNLKKAKRHYENSRALIVKLNNLVPDNVVLVRDLWKCNIHLGDLFLKLGNLEKALEKYKLALVLNKKRRKIQRMDLDSDLADTYGRLGDLYEKKLQKAKSIKFHKKSLFINKKLWNLSNYNHNNFLERIALNYDKIGDFYLNWDDLNCARKKYKQSLEIRRRLNRMEPDNLDYELHLAIIHGRLGDIYLELGRFVKAKEHYEKVYKTVKNLRELVPDNLIYEQALAVFYEKLGDLYLKLEDTKQASNHFSQELVIRQKLAKLAPENRDYKLGLVLCYCRVFSLYYKLNKIKQADRYLGLCREVITDMKIRGMYIDKSLRDLLN